MHICKMMVHTKCSGERPGHASGLSLIVAFCLFLIFILFTAAFKLCCYSVRLYLYEVNKLCNFTALAALECQLIWTCPSW